MVLRHIVAVVGDRHDHEDRHDIGHAEAQRATADIIGRSPPRQARRHEQAGDEEHAGHEIAVVEQRDEIEAEPVHAVAALAEIGVIDRGVIQHDRQRDEGPGAVERDDPAGDRLGLLQVRGHAVMHRNGVQWISRGHAAPDITIFRTAPGRYPACVCEPCADAGMITNASSQDRPRKAGNKPSASSLSLPVSPMRTTGEHDELR